jgi:hypothetical protein
VLGLHALWGGKPSGTSRIAKPGTHLGVWWWALGTEEQVEGTSGTPKPASLNHLVPTRQQRPWGLLALERGLPGAMTAAVGMRDASLQAVRALRPACCHQATRATIAAVGMGNQACAQQEVPDCGPGFRECSTVSLLLVQGNQTCRHREPWGLLACTDYQELQQLLQP